MTKRLNLSGVVHHDSNVPAHRDVDGYGGRFVARSDAELAHAAVVLKSLKPSTRLSRSLEILQFPAKTAEGN